MLFAGESHTLGNALKNVILQNPSVTFCGYSIPHPAEDQMFLRIQTAEGGAETASDVLKRGFVDLKKMCAITRKKFNKEREEFQVGLHSSQSSSYEALYFIGFTDIFPNPGQTPSNLTN